jgi:Ni2+-binding GTPase involved in maturation of urease and hydrogenase
MGVQVTVVTGWLGAGKTSMITHLLRESKLRILVVENELGSIGVDHELLVSGSDIGKEEVRCHHLPHVCFAAPSSHCPARGFRSEFVWGPTELPDRVFH